MHHAFLLVGHHAPQCCLEQKNKQHILQRAHIARCTYCKVHIPRMCSVPWSRWCSAGKIRTSPHSISSGPNGNTTI
jgi:hypothetical protein